MKILIAVLIILSSLHAWSAQVISANIDESGENLVVEVRYGGGCVDHYFDLDMFMCYEFEPIQCMAMLVEKIPGGVDTCAALITEKVTFNLQHYRLTDEYFRGASFTIYGDELADGIESSATVILPGR
jgi:hypothetical protein